MLRVGLTGGIGCGKSTVAGVMHERGCHVLDADRIAHQLIEPGQPAYDIVVREFGRQILAADGRIDRSRLAAVVFADPPRLARLNAILHPRVLEELDRQFAEIEKRDPHGVAVAEAALLIESGYHERLDRVVVVWCRPEQQRERLTEPSFGRGMSREEAERRMNAQMNLAEKRRHADEEIDGSGTLEETRRQAAELAERLKRLAGAPPQPRAPR
jgi:dephospho-CoA kinase